MATRIELRGGTAAAWAAKDALLDATGGLILSAREPGVETDTGRMKIGDGVKRWSALSYVLDSANLYQRIDLGYDPATGILSYYPDGAVPTGQQVTTQIVNGQLVVQQGGTAIPLSNGSFATVAKAATLWASGSTFVVGQPVINPSGELVKTTTAHTATTTYDATKFSTPASATYATYLSLAANPDAIIVGAITRDANGAATSAGVVWPDGSTGTYTADTVSTSFPGAVDAYHITKVTGGVTTTYTQSLVTRNASGAVTVRPALTVA